MQLIEWRAACAQPLFRAQPSIEQPPAAFLSGVVSAHMVLAEGPEQFRPLARARRAPLHALSQQVFDDCGTKCQWLQQSHTMDASAIQDVLPLAPCDVGRCLGDRQGAAFLDGCDLDTRDGKRVAVRLRSTAGAVASAWLLTARGESTTLGELPLWLAAATTWAWRCPQP